MRRYSTLVAIVAAILSLLLIPAMAQAMPTCPNGSTPAQNTEYPSTEMSLSAQESGLWEGNNGEYANGTATYNVYTDKNGFFYFMQEYSFAATEFHAAFSYKKDAPLCGKELPGKPPHEEEHHEPPPHEKEKEIVKEKEREIVKESSGSSSEATACSYAVVACSSAAVASASIVVNTPAVAVPTCEQIMPASTCKPSPPAPAPETCEQSKTCKPSPPHHPGKCVDNRGTVKLVKSSRIAPAVGQITLRLVGPGTKHLHGVHLHIDQAAYGSTLNRAPFVWTIPVKQFASPNGRLYGFHGVKVTGKFKCSKWHVEEQIFSNDPPGHIRKG